MKTISNIQIQSPHFATIPTKLMGRCMTTNLCIIDIEIDEVVYIQNQQLFIMLTMHLKD